MLPILAQPGDSDVRPIERAYRLRAYLTPAQARLLRRLFHDRDENAAVNIESEARRILGMPLRGSTRRSRESNARGEAACAADRTASAGQPTSLNREFAYRAERRSPERGGMEPPRDGVG